MTKIWKIINKYRVSIILVGLVLFGAGLRLYQLSSLPSGLNRDEAALAYNAALLKQTGKDEWGRTWPIALESFGDYKLPGYPYILIASYQIFGENDFAVRLPAAVAGTVLIVIGYIFARQVLKFQQPTALAIAALICFQPVFFFYSRMAWEATVGLAFFVTGLCFLFAETRGDKRFLKMGIGLLLLLLAILTYNTPLLLLPFISLALIIYDGVKNWRNWLLPVGGIGLIFVIGFSTFGSISKQKSGITIFNDETIWRQSVVEYEFYQGPARKVLANRFVFFGKLIGQRYLASWSPVFLVEKGGQHPWHNLPGFGHLYWTTYVLALVGTGLLIKRIYLTQQKDERRRALTLLFLLLTSLAPAVITVDAPHATRSLFFFFLLMMVAGGTVEALYVVSVEINHKALQQKRVVFLAVLIGIGICVESQHYLTTYFTQYPQLSRSILQEGLLPVLEKTEAELGQKSDQVAIVDPDGYLYIQVAWLLQLPPDQFFSTIDRHLPDRIGFRYGYRLGRYRFIAHRPDRQPADKRIIEWSAEHGWWSE